MKSRKNYKYKKLKESVQKCELCGSKRGLEVHHIIPKVCEIKYFDAENDDNLVVLCKRCHSVLSNSSQLTKYGIAKRKCKNDELRRLESFYGLCNEMLEKNNELTACDVMDIFDVWFDTEILKLEVDEEE